MLYVLNNIVKVHLITVLYVLNNIVKVHLITVLYVLNNIVKSAPNYSVVCAQQCC